jgi:hypothetical protein
MLEHAKWATLTCHAPGLDQALMVHRSAVLLQCLHPGC